LVARNPISYLNNTLQAGKYYVARFCGSDRARRTAVGWRETAGL
jgi:hypothetical protein